MDVVQIRKQNINRLAEKYGRGGLADKLGYKDTIYINQLCGGHGSFGGRTARKIEAALNLEHGWMDAIHNIDYSNGENPEPLEQNRITERSSESYDFFASVSRVNLGHKYRDTSQPVRDMIDDILDMSKQDAERFVQVYRTIRDQMYVGGNKK